MFLKKNLFYQAKVKNELVLSSNFAQNSHSTKSWNFGFFYVYNCLKLPSCPFHTSQTYFVVKIKIKSLNSTKAWNIHQKS